MTTRAALLAALCAIAVGAGCGDDDGPPSSQQTRSADPNGLGTTNDSTGPAPTGEPLPEDKRGIALRCIREEKGVDARPVGDKGIQVGPGDEGPKIDFYQSSLEAEGVQFEGRAEGASQIGAALLYVREAPEEQLIALEECLNDQ
jgi:hypothetical protein